MIFIWNFQTTLEALGTLAASANIYYMYTLLRGVDLRQPNTFYVEVVSKTIPHVQNIILGLGTYFFPVNALSKQNRTMRRGTNKPRSLEVIRYGAHMIDLNDYFSVSPGEKEIDKIY